MITPELLTSAKLCNEGTAQKWAPFLAAAAEKYEINTPLRIAGWLSQCAHESGNFRALEENLNYSAEGLLKVFGKYFDTPKAMLYARQPEKIGNLVYANRMGNASELSGDGFKYRGRGLIQLTGKGNYKAFGQGIGEVDKIMTQPGLVATPEYAALSAGWFWAHNSLNSLADLKDVKGMTKVINGGFNGLDHRKELYEQLSKALQI